MSSPKFKTIKPLRDALISGFAVFFIAVTCNYLVYHYAALSMKQDLQNYISEVAQTAALFTDAKAHKQLTKPEDDNTEGYLQIKHTYQRIIKANPQIKYIYSVILQNNKPYFVVDSQPKTDKAGEGPAKIMEEYEDYTETMMNALVQKTLFVEEEPYSDKWGTFLSAYVPFYDSNNEFVGIVGADMELGQYNFNRFKILSAFFIGLFFAAALSLMLALFVLRVRRKHKKEFDAALNRRNLSIEFDKSIKAVVGKFAQSSAEINHEINEIIGLIATSEQMAKLVNEEAIASAESCKAVTYSSDYLAKMIDTVTEEVEQCSQSTASAVKFSAEADKAARELKDATKKVLGLAEIIADIAEQTKLLSLNASIEAARAGDAGLGFAVVANQIKLLSEQTKSQTDSISSYIKSLISASELTVDTIGKSSAEIKATEKIFEQLIQMISNQADVTKEILKDIYDVYIRNDSISRSVADVKHFAEQSNQNTANIQKSIHALSEQGQALQHKVNNFLQGIVD